MRPFRPALLCLALLIAPLAALPPMPAHAQSGAIAAGDSSGAAQGQADAAIATRIRAILHELGGYGDVTVNVRAGIVTLRGTVLDADALGRLTTLSERVEGVVAVENQVTLSTDVAERLMPAWERFVQRLRQAMTYLPLAGIALIAFGLVAWAGFLLAGWRRPWDRLAPNAFIAEIYQTVVRIVALLAGVVVALDILGATALLSTILGAAGIIGLAIGFAVRDTVENFIASVLLSIRQPFRPNDAIEINGDEGKVIRLTARATILLSYDGNQIRIPNATVFKSRIVNYSRNPERRFRIDLGVGYGTDLAAAKARATEVLTGLPFVLERPAPAAWTTTLNGSDIGMSLTAWIDQRETDLLAARSEAVRQLLIAFEAAGIEMPEPTYRLLGLAGPQAPEAAAATAPAPVPSPAATQPVQEVQDVSPEADASLETIVNEERADARKPDLLNPAAPEE